MGFSEENGVGVGLDGINLLQILKLDPKIIEILEHDQVVLPVLSSDGVAFGFDASSELLGLSLLFGVHCLLRHLLLDILARSARSGASKGSGIVEHCGDRDVV